MEFANKIQSTAIDWPGHIACIVYTLGCNLDCDFCHNKVLVRKQVDTISSVALFEQIKRRKGFYDHVVITGGEPTINVALPDFCRQLKDVGFKIKLDTNGLRPVMLEKLIKEKLVDYVAMDLKTSLDRYGRFLDSRMTQLGVSYDHLHNLMTSIRILRDSELEYEYRTTPTKTTCALIDFNNIRVLLEMAYQNSQQSYKPNWFIQTTRQIEDGNLALYTEEELKRIVDRLKDEVSFVNIHFR